MDSVYKMPLDYLEKQKADFEEMQIWLAIDIEKYDKKWSEACKTIMRAKVKAESALWHKNYAIKLRDNGKKIVEKLTLEIKERANE